MDPVGERHGMKRREMIKLLGSLALAWPLMARAQQPPIPVIGFLHAGSPEPNVDLVTAFRQGLAEAGYVEGKNATLEFRWADGQYGRLSELASDLLRHKVAIIAAFGNAASRAAKAATATIIPVVFASSSDPVAVGLVTSLNRPDANMTGVSIMNQELEWTRLERLMEVVPHVTAIAFLVNPDSPTTATKLREMQSAARMLGRQLHVLNARSEREFETAFAAIDQQRIGAMVVASDNVFLNKSMNLGQVSARHGIPVIGAYRDFARAGGLMSYGTDLADAYRQVGVCTGSILQGDSPADLPVRECTKVDFVINLKTANALGLKIPPTLLALAGELIG